MEITHQFKTAYIKAIASGETEARILKRMGVDWLDFFETLADDPQFRKDIEEARKHRAEVWVNKIVESLEPTEDIQASQVPGLKLEFEKLKFLAGADNPDRYGTAAKGAKVDVNVDFKQFQLLAPSEALKALQEDPFNQPVLVDGRVINGENDGEKEER
jgi:hypothetical protein